MAIAADPAAHSSRGSPQRDRATSPGCAITGSISAGSSLRLVRGEFHRHTEFTSHRDQDGLLEDTWRYALDAADLDWMGNGDHDNGFGHEYMWWLIQKMTDLHHHPPGFVAAHDLRAQRRLSQRPSQRDHAAARHPAAALRRAARGPTEEGTPDTKMLYAYLKHFGGICASHTSATDMGTDWRDNDPEVEPVVEIYQGHRHNYEHFGAPRSATAETQIGGYQPAGLHLERLREGLPAWLRELQRPRQHALELRRRAGRRRLAAGHHRRLQASGTATPRPTTSSLDVRSGDHLMGDSSTPTEQPTLAIKVDGHRPDRQVPRGPRQQVRLHDRARSRAALS